MMLESQVGPKRVLVIEDYPDSAEILCLALQSHGHTGLRAAQGGQDGRI